MSAGERPASAAASSITALSSGNVRVSLHRETTAAEVDEFLTALPGVVAGIRAELGASGL